MKPLLLVVAVGALVALGVVCWAADRVTEHVQRLDELLDGPRDFHPPAAPDPFAAALADTTMQDFDFTLWAVEGWGANQ